VHDNKGNKKELIMTGYEISYKYPRWYMADVLSDLRESSKVKRCAFVVYVIGSFHEVNVWLWKKRRKVHNY
jgi:hypothetical protein